MNKTTKNYLSLLVILFIISSCSTNSHLKKLTDANRMLNEQKLDSAAHMLKTVDANSLAKSKQDSMYYTLLCLKYKDKVGKPFTYIDSTLSLRLISYFENHDKQMLPEAYYYTGRLHQMRNNYPMALDFYQKSQSLLEKGCEDIQLKALVYGQISDVFYFQGIQPKAIEMNKKAIACFEELKDTSSLVTLLVNTAYIYLEQGHYYVCMKFLKRAEQLIQNKVHEKNDL